MPLSCGRGEGKGNGNGAGAMDSEEEAGYNLKVGARSWVKYGAMKKGQQWCVYSFLDCPQGW
jgi:hypothetical protein